MSRIGSCVGSRVGSLVLVASCVLASARAASGQSAQPGPPSERRAQLAPADSVAILAAERTVLDAFVNRDTAAVNRPVERNMVIMQPDGLGTYNWTGGPGTVLACTTSPYALSQVTLRPVGRDGAVLAYRYVGKQTCNGRAQPDTNLVMTVYERTGPRTWKRAAFAYLVPGAKP